MLVLNSRATVLCYTMYSTRVMECCMPASARDAIMHPNVYQGCCCFIKHVLWKVSTEAAIPMLHLRDVIYKGSIVSLLKSMFHKDY